MLRISEQQMASLKEAYTKSYEDRMLKHLRQFFPEQCGALGESNTRLAIRYGIERAKNYGVVSERDVCIYIDVMFTFGKDFDQDPDLPWANSILNDQKIRNPRTRVDRLHDAAVLSAQRRSSQW